MGGMWGGTPSKAGARRVLDNAADRAMGSRSADAVYLTSLFVTGVVSGVLLWVGRRLSR